MDLEGIGYSNIRLPNDSSNYIYTYNQSVNTFPEEVFVHEFLHTLERMLKERNYDIPNLHDYEQYGYVEERLVGLKKWYSDYMTCNIKKSDGTKTGLNESVYTLTPPAKSDFKNATEVKFSKEPQNIFQGIGNMFKSILNLFK